MTTIKEQLIMVNEISDYDIFEKDNNKDDILNKLLIQDISVTKVVCDLIKDRKILNTTEIIRDTNMLSDALKNNIAISSNNCNCEEKQRIKKELNMNSTFDIITTVLNNYHDKPYLETIIRMMIMTKDYSACLKIYIILIKYPYIWNDVYSIKTFEMLIKDINLAKLDLMNIKGKNNLVSAIKFRRKSDIYLDRLEYFNFFYNLIIEDYNQKLEYDSNITSTDKSDPTYVKTIDN